ncbi:hypothetical protein E9840_01275 [Tissierella creatinini]|nr:hypothetical protein E9840_01275 [Tissierella creatinini]TJX64179.1 hypothetical protein E8P77_13075 [Soehngenia saccharolytica]
MSVKVGKFVYWAPRIMSILFILFLAMFSLDVIEPGRSVGDIIIGLIMHNIPVFILIGLLIIAWKHELVGAVTFITAGLLYSGLTVFNAIQSEIPWYLSISWSLTIAGPAFIVGILFLLNWKSKRQQNLK